MSGLKVQFKLSQILIIILIFILSSVVQTGSLANYDSDTKPSYLSQNQPFLGFKSLSNRQSTPRADLVTFTNVTPDAGLGGVNGNFYSWVDYNNDGYQDLLVNGGRLFRNNGLPDFKFTEVTSSVGLSGTGNGAWADYDNDGNLDFYCCGADKLWHNEGAPDYKFNDVTTEAGNITDDYPTTAVGWGDYDLDGYLDMYIANGEDWNDGDPIYYPDFMYHNNGDGTFTDVTVESGIRNFGGPYYGRGIAWGDYDDDGWPDIYISNYRISQNWLFHNNRNGTFTDLAIQKGVAGEESQRMGTTYYGHTVGSAWADLDNDGYLDLFESNLAHKDLYRGPICGDSQLYKNNGPLDDYYFTDERDGSGLTEKNIGAGEDDLFVGIAIGDFDNDGFQDLFIPQIYDLEYSYSYLYHNNGDWTFTNVSEDVGVLVWNTYGGAWCDYNNDGFIDLVTGGKGTAEPNTTSEVHLYRNNGNTNSWLQVKLEGNHYNKFGIGVRVKVSAPGQGIVQIRELEGGMGCHSSQNSIPVEFGFGSYSGTLTVEVLWPSGYVQKFENVELNQQLLIKETTQAPELHFINVNVLDDHPIQGETITIEATVANMGYIEADRTVIKFFEGARSTGHGGTEIGEPQVIFDLGKFQSKKVTTSWNLSGFTGEHEIWAVIDEVEPPEIVISNNAMNCSIIIRSENQLPVARLTVIPEGVLYTGDTLFFDGRNSTDDISVKLYIFDFDDGNTSGWISNSELYYQYQTPGTFIASLKVKDTDGAISTNLAQKKLTIKQTVEPVPNRAPVIDRFTANPIEVEVQESVNLKIIAHDPDDDELTYHLQADNGELKNNELSSSATWTAPSTAGTFSISARVFDGELYSESITTEINVYKETKNHMPVIQQIVLDPTEVVIGSSVSITVTAYDPDPDDVLSYNYEVTDGNILGEGSRVIWRTPDVPDIYFIKVEVVDNGGLYDEDEILVNVIEINYEPEILDSDVEPSTIREDKGETVLFTIELFDENGLDDIYSVKIDISSLGGKSTQKMYDNGKYGDIQSGDGIYSYEYFVSRGMSVGEVTITITIKDLAMNEVIYDVELEIEKGKGEDATGGTFLPGFEGNLTIICMGCIIIFLSIIKRKKYKK